MYPGEYPFTLASELPGKFFLSALFHRKYVINYACIVYACAKCSRVHARHYFYDARAICIAGVALASARCQTRKVYDLWHSIAILPGSLTTIPFILQDLPGAPGCSREITREDSRVKFPKSLPAFYPRFYLRDLSYYKISRVHPGKIC